MMDKPAKAEDEYFARLEFERSKKEIEARQATIKEEERARLKELHYMRCPKCGVEMAEIAFRGVKVDRCVSCNGIYFDGGEVDQLLAQSEGFLSRLVGIFK